MRLPHNLFRFSFDWNDEHRCIDADNLLAHLPATARDRILAATPRDTVIGWGQLEDANRLLDEDDPDEQQQVEDLRRPRTRSATPSTRPAATARTTTTTL